MSVNKIPQVKTDKNIFSNKKNGKLSGDAIRCSIFDTYIYPLTAIQTFIMLDLYVLAEK